MCCYAELIIDDALWMATQKAARSPGFCITDRFLVSAAILISAILTWKHVGNYIF